MGAKYVENRQVEFAKSYEESGPGTPIFFILSPGVDPLKDVEALGKKLGFTFDNKNFHNVSLGQVREKNAALVLYSCRKTLYGVICAREQNVWHPNLLQGKTNRNKRLNIVSLCRVGQAEEILSYNFFWSILKGTFKRNCDRWAELSAFLMSCGFMIIKFKVFICRVKKSSQSRVWT